MLRIACWYLLLVPLLAVAGEGDPPPPAAVPLGSGTWVIKERLPDWRIDISIEVADEGEYAQRGTMWLKNMKVEMDETGVITREGAVIRKVFDTALGGEMSWPILEEAKGKFVVMAWDKRVALIQVRAGEPQVESAP